MSSPRLMRNEKILGMLQKNYYSYSALRRAGFSHYWKKRIKAIPIRIGRGVYYPKGEIDEFLESKGMHIIDRGNFVYEIELTPTIKQNKEDQPEVDCEA